MRRSLYVSTAIHAAILLWVAFGHVVARQSPQTPFEVTGVTLISSADFDAMFDQAPPATAPEVQLAPDPRPADPEPPPPPRPSPRPPPRRRPNRPPRPSLNHSRCPPRRVR